MQGLVLNEDGYVTYPYDVFKHIEKQVKSLNWRVTNVECGSPDSFEFSFERQMDNFISGVELYQLLEEHPRIQWWRGTLSGFSKDISWE